VEANGNLLMCRILVMVSHPKVIPDRSFGN